MDRPYDVLTVDCYGTLIDWEAGITRAFSDAARRDGVALDASAVLPDRNLLLGRPWLEVLDTPSAGLHRIGRCAFFLGITTAGLSLVP